MPLMIQILQLPLWDAPVSAWHDLHEGNYMLTVETAYTGREVTALWYKDRDLIWTDGKMFLSNKNIVGKPEIKKGLRFVDLRLF